MRKLAAGTVSKIKTFRRHGFSIPEISRKLLIPKSTVFRYIQGVAIAPEYYQRWQDRRNASKIISLRNWQIAEKNAKEMLPRITKREMAIMGAMLYWGEGSKGDFSFSNTDPQMIRFFLKILRSAFGIKDSEIKVSLRIYEDLDRKKCLKFWSKTTRIKLDSTTSINVLKGSKKGKLKYGMCRIRVRKSGLLLKQILSIIKLLAETPS